LKIYSDRHVVYFSLYDYIIKMLNSII